MGTAGCDVSSRTRGGSFAGLPEGPVVCGEACGAVAGATAGAAGGLSVGSPPESTPGGAWFSFCVAGAGAWDTGTARTWRPRLVLVLPRRGGSSELREGNGALLLASPVPLLLLALALLPLPWRLPWPTSAPTRGASGSGAARLPLLPWLTSRPRFTVATRRCGGLLRRAVRPPPSAGSLSCWARLWRSAADGLRLWLWWRRRVLPLSRAGVGGTAAADAAATFSTTPASTELMASGVREPGGAL